MVEGVYGFYRSYHWLSNFFVLDVPVVDGYGIQYDSTEAFYQAHKTTDRNTRLMFSSLNPSQSKKAGRVFANYIDADVVFVDGGGKPTLFEATSKFKLDELAKRKQALDAAQAEYDELYNTLAEDN